MKSRILDLYFHSPCFDGIVSAVLCWDFFESRGEADKVRLHPVGYGLRGRWLSKSLPEHSAVVDFLFHPHAKFWVDHHATSFLTNVAQKQFANPKSTTWIYDARAKSCAALLRKYLHKRFGYRNHRYDAIVDWADRIDSATYKDVRQALLAPTAALQISLSLADADAAYCERIVRELKTQSPTAVASSSHVQRRVRAAKASLKDGLKEFAKAARLEGEIVVFDVDASRTVVNRYAPYYFYPKARYSVGVMRLGDSAKITAMRNPWRRFESVPIGSILARHGGGGHQRVGSLLLKGHAKQRAQQLLTKLVEEIREQDQAHARETA